MGSLVDMFDRLSASTFFKGRGPARQYAAVALAIVLATVLRLIIGPVVADRIPYLFFFPVILAASVLCDLGPLIAAIAGSILAAELFVLEPGLQLRPLGSAPNFEHLAFLLTSLCIVVLGRLARSALLRARQAAAAERAGLDSLRRNEERFRTLLSATSEIIWVAAADGAFASPQPVWSTFTGQDWEAQRGFGWIEALHPEDRPPTRAALKKAVAERKAFMVTARLWHAPSGSYRSIEARGAPILNSDGTIQEWIGTVSDVHDRERVSEERRESEDKLHIALQAVAGGAWSYDLASGAIDWTPQSLELFGFDPSSGPPTYDQWRQTVIPDDRAVADRAVQTAIRERSDIQLIYRIQHPKRGLRWIEARGRLVRDRSGQPIRLVGISLDITERKRAEQERDVLLTSERAARSDAERTSRMKDEFLATLSHELRTPLNAILGWTQLIRRGDVGQEELDEALETIERNARAQTSIMNDLLDMSRIISGKVRLQVESVDLPSLIETALESVRPAAQAKGITLETEIDPRSGRMNGDPNRLQQIVWNLTHNAIKFTPPSGHVEIRLLREDATLVLDVTDTGQGIRPDFLPHIFERFRQADPSTTRRHGGLGLGLAIVKNLVELHGGSVQVSSEGEGLGATFTVRLPALALRVSESEEGRPARPARTELTGDDSAPDLRGLRVLVVDDERDARELVRRVLREYHADVSIAASVDEALAVFESERPDVLIGDIGMPERDGFDLIRSIRARSTEQGGKTPAVALTAFVRAEDRIRTLRAGYQIHVSKPVEPAELVTVIANLAGRRQATNT